MQCQKLKTYMETGRVVFLPVRSIRPNPAQPRKIFREEALDELADSIRQHGILQPLSVRRVGNNYELISGERRLRAAELAGVADVPCILMSMDDKASGFAALVENLQRQDLDFIEEAMGIRRLIQEHSMAQEQAARAEKAEAEVEEPSGRLYRVQVGAYAQRSNAEAMAERLKGAGFEAIIV